MAVLEDLKAGAFIAGLAPGGTARIVYAERFGDQAVKVTYEDASGAVGNRLVYRNEEPSLEVVQAGRPWSFDGDGALLRLVSEAYRIRLAHLFDPYLAVHTSRIDPLPHQITAVYGEMLPRQPLRFLLADDPGAGKTIMAGLLIKELMLRGDVERCLVVAPGALVEQWQDELHEKFGLPFDILTRDQVEAARTANPFAERSLLIARLDVLSRNPDLQSRLEAAPEWDLVVCDEAHRMSASFFGGEVKHTRRYRLGQRLGGCARHFLLMTATPHNGKEQDFQLFMALLDADRFEGRFRDGVHQADVSDLMRRLTKEELLRFDGRPLFPERHAYTVKYELSEAEAVLYAEVTAYVREEMNRAERFAAEGDDHRRRNVGFALQTLQRRLASSPAAIHESLRRRRERLEARLAEERLVQRGREAGPSAGAGLSAGPALPAWSDEDEAEIEDAPGDEAEATEEAILDRATAARTIAELATEIDTLGRLQARAAALRRSGADTKWIELNGILDHPLMADGDGNRRKLIVFTEPRDTLNYLANRIRTRLGRPEAVVVIHGGVGREERRKAVEAFTHDKEVLVLVANDAAGEGINLQRAHLMVNYDLPWNPNRLEQRFGRIHRIGQSEVCHCWNLVATDTREGAVYSRLLDKIEVARAALGGRVYDVLGRLFEARALRDLLMEAIRYGERPDVKERLFQAVDTVGDRQHILDLLTERALVRDTMTIADIALMREEMERAEARRLQPFYIRTFFLEAFRHLGGHIHRRETGRWEITRVPGPIRERDRLIGVGAPVQPRYERVCFEKEGIDQPPGRGLAPSRPSPDRRHHGPRSRTLPRTAQARCGAGGRDRRRRGAPRAVLPRTRGAGRSRRSRRPPAGRFPTTPVRGNRRGRPHARRRTRAPSRLPAAGARRTNADCGSARRAVAVGRSGREGHRPRNRLHRPAACRGGARPAPAGDRQGGARGHRAAEEGDELLGPPRRGSEGARTRRPAHPPLGRPGRGARERPRRPPAAAPRRAGQGARHLGVAAAGARRGHRRARRAADRDDPASRRRTPDHARGPRRRRALGDGGGDGRRTRARPCTQGRERRTHRLRHRVPRGRHGPPAVHRGQGAAPRAPTR